MRAVSNSRPLIALSAIGHFSILRHLHEELFIPEAVYREVALVPGAPPERGPRQVEEGSVEDGFDGSGSTTRCP